jgi:hypothetical protein
MEPRIQYAQTKDGDLKSDDNWTRFACPSTVDGTAHTGLCFTRKRSRVQALHRPPQIQKSPLNWTMAP